MLSKQVAYKASSQEIKSLLDKALKLSRDYADRFMAGDIAGRNEVLLKLLDVKEKMLKAGMITSDEEFSDILEYLHIYSLDRR